jgi:hypothetical protein
LLGRAKTATLISWPMAKCPGTDDRIFSADSGQSQP